MLWRAGLSRDRLDRSHPLLRRATRLTWFPFTGHRAATEDVRGVAPNSSTITFDPNPVFGTFLRIEGSQVLNTGLTARAMGVNGSNTPFTIVWAHQHWANLTTTGGFLFAFGDNGNGSNIEANARSTGVRLGNWQQYALADPGLQTSPDYTKTVLVSVVFDGSVFRMVLRAFNPNSNGWEAILSNTTPSTSNNLSDAKNLRFASNTASDGGHAAWTGLNFWGCFAGVAWTEAEQQTFALNPDAIWSPRWPIILGQAAAGGGSTFNDTISDAGTLADSLGVALTGNATLADAGTGADSLGVALTVAAAIADAGTAADSLGVALTVASAIADAGTAADSLGVALTVAAAIADAGTVAEALAASAVLGVTLADGGTLADGLGAAVTFAVSISDAGTGSDSASDGNVFGETIADAGTLADSLAVTVTFAGAIADAGALADALGAAVTFAVAIGDAATLADAFSVPALQEVPLTTAVMDAVLAALEAADLELRGVPVQLARSRRDPVSPEHEGPLLAISCGDLQVEATTTLQQHSIVRVTIAGYLAGGSDVQAERDAAWLYASVVRALVRPDPAANPVALVAGVDTEIWLEEAGARFEAASVEESEFPSATFLADFTARVQMQVGNPFILAA